MPEIAEIKKGWQLGRKRDHHKYIWGICERCGKGRWVMMKLGEPRSQLCHACNLKWRWAWKGGKKCDGHGYIMVKLEPDNFFYPMAQSTGYVFEHRLIVAKRLGRCLHSWEIVHHKDGVRDHNSDSNLQLVQEMQHRQMIRLERKIEDLQKRVTVLEAENAVLKAIYNGQNNSCVP